MTSDWEVTGSNTRRYTHYPKIFSWFYSVPPGKFRFRALSYITITQFQFIIHSHNYEKSIILSQVTCSGVEGSASSIQELAVAWTIRSSNPGGSKTFCLFRTRPDYPWGPTSLLVNGYQDPFPGLRRSVRDVDRPVHLAPRLQMITATPLPPVSLYDILFIYRGTLRTVIKQARQCLLYAAGTICILNMFCVFPVSDHFVSNAALY